MNASSSAVHRLTSSLHGVSDAQIANAVHSAALTSKALSHSGDAALLFVGQVADQLESVSYQRAEVLA